MDTLINVAYRKNVNATTDRAKPDSVAFYAVDGFSTGEERHSAYVGNDGDTQTPKLQLDLGTVYPVKEIKISGPDSEIRKQTIHVSLYRTHQQSSSDLSLDDDWDACSSCVFSTTITIVQGGCRLVLDEAADARFVVISSSSEFAINALGVLALNPLASLVDPGKQDDVDFSTLLEVVEMYWGSDVSLAPALNELRKQSSIKLSALEIHELNYQRLDIGFHLNKLDVKAWLSSIETDSGACNILLMLELPMNRQRWDCFFGPLLDKQKDDFEQQSGKRFSSRSKLIIPLDGAMSLLLNHDSDRPGRSTMQDCSRVSLPFTDISALGQAFLANLVSEEICNDFTLTLEAGVNFLTPMEIGFLPRYVLDNPEFDDRFDVTNSILGGAINARFLGLFDEDWVDPDVLWLRAVVKRRVTATPSPMQFKQSAFLIHAPNVGIEQKLAIVFQGIP
ncbi:MAG: hypothetical protein ACI9SP_001038 [Arenicella sp.]|jgi:hypothetical protein